MLIFGNKKQTSQKYYRTLIFFIIMLGYMQRVSRFWAQMGKGAGCQLGRFCPEPFNWYWYLVLVLSLLAQLINKYLPIRIK